MIRAVVRLVLLSALRDWLFYGLLALIVAVFALSLFLGNAALIEQSEAGRVFAAGTARIVVIVGPVTFVAFLTQRFFESREIEVIFSRSLSRGSFVLAYWVGLVSSAVVLIAVVAALIVLIFGPSHAVLIWSASLAVECFVIVAFAQFAALTLERATVAVILTLAFYALTRLVGFFLGIRQLIPPEGWYRILGSALDTLALLTPRIDLLTQTDWLIYGFSLSQQFVFAVTQSAAFVVLLLGATIFDISRKQF